MTFSWGGYLLGFFTSALVFGALFVGIVIGARKAPEINRDAKQGMRVS